MTAKKYEILQDQTLEHYGRTLYRIRRLRDGLIGGWIQKEENLSQEGDCFVRGDAKVYGEAKVYGNAVIHDHAEVYGNALVYDNAWIHDDARVSGYSQVYGDAHVFWQARVYGDSHVFGNAKVRGFVNVYDRAKVYGNAYLHGSAKVFGDAHAHDGAKMSDNAVASVDVVFKKMPRHDITVTDKHVRVGCEVHAFEYWEKHIEEIGEWHEYTDEEIALYKETIFALIAQRRAQGF